MTAKYPLGTSVVMSKPAVHPLRAFREQENLSQEALAKRLKVNRVSVTRWESGARKPNKDVLQKIWRATGIAPCDLRPDLAQLLQEPAQ